VAWRLDDLDGKPEGLAFGPSGCAIMALDKHKAHNSVMRLIPAIATSPDEDG